MDDPLRARSKADVRERITGGALTLLFGAPCVWFASSALRSRFGPPTNDPHGYIMIFGTLFAVALGLATALVVPLMLPRDRRVVGYVVSGCAFAVMSAGLLVALVMA